MEPARETVLFGVAAPRGFYPALVALAVLVAALVNAGNLNNIDAVRRLRATHSWWAGTPEVAPDDTAGMWTRDARGRYHTTYGMGHSLAMLPADLAASAIARLAPIPEGARGPAREALVAFFSQALIAPAAILLAYLLLRRLAFGHTAAAGGAAALLAGTTMLHYVQNCQENALLLACALGGFFFSANWLATRRGRDAALAGAACGYALLTRLTALADIGAVLLFVAPLARGRGGWRRFLAGFGPVFGGFVLAERLYQFARYGEWTGNYYRAPAAGGVWFSHALGPGITEALWSPGNSIFLFDPLLAASCVLLALFWRRLGTARRAYAGAAAALLAVLVVFYGAFLNPTGEVSWGDRYVSVPVHLLALLAVPLALEYLGAGGRRVVLAVTALSVLIQVGSLLLISAVEVDQGAHYGLRWLVPLRFENIWLVVTGRTGGSPYWAGVPEEWRRLNLLPFQMGLRYPGLARVALAGWAALAFAAAAVALRLKRLARLPFSSTSPAGICDADARR